MRTDTALANGVVRKVDRPSGMITIEHDALENVGMPPMTMAYKAKGATVLQQAKEGVAPGPYDTVPLAPQTLDPSCTWSLTMGRFESLGWGGH